uniref:thymus-specific serine protease n=1 Tax=Euleptes europaea TaxID=460621 RepID=UPI0025402F36|nr:thymus-specific serine protease [Euleptes europaea]
MGAWKLSLGAWLLVLLSLTQAGRNFRLFRQYILQHREEQAIKEASLHLGLLAQSPASGLWNPPIESTIRQPLDHFNRQDQLTFNQRFWINEEYWQHPSGPVFLYIGGESALSMWDVLSGHHVELAQKYGALLVALEHRFYGASLNPDGLQDQNLMFLSSQQALSDLVSFHLFITQKYNLMSNNTWICFGGSYPGSLSAWFRLKFPHLVFAAVSSSAPVRAQLDFRGYNKVVADSLLNPVVGGSKECRDAVAEAFSIVDSLIHAGHLEKLAKDFHSCGALKGTSDLFEMVSNLADIFMGAVQYNDEGVQWGSVASLCRIMTNQTGSPYQRLMVTNKVFLISMMQQCLENSHEEVLRELRSTNLSVSGVGERQWFFQTCTEFGYYQTCEDSTCLFSHLISLPSELDICAEVFNVSRDRVQEAVAFTNEYYGADCPKASRVLFVNGDIDPWHALSVLRNQSRSELALLINGTAHCANMMPSRPTDPLPLIQARKWISAQVGEWLELAQKITGDH